jgi:SAM-dependent methyltransferase
MGAVLERTTVAIWAAYVRWLDSESAAVSPDDLLNRYELKLKAEGLSGCEIAVTLQAVVETLDNDPEGWRLMFDCVYRGKGSGLSLQPNQFLVETVDRLTAGAALDINMGQGRNAVFLASRGWHVTGFDISEEGVAAARLAAFERNVRLQAWVCREENVDYGSSCWDLTVCTYNPVPIADEAFARKIHNSLKPGGYMLIESFAHDPAKGRHRVGVEIDANQLLAAFRGFHIVRYEQVTAVPDWASKPEPIVRLLARRT